MDMTKESSGLYRLDCNRYYLEICGNDRLLYSLLSTDWLSRFIYFPCMAFHASIFTVNFFVAKFSLSINLHGCAVLLIEKEVRFSVITLVRNIICFVCFYKIILKITL